MMCNLRFVWVVLRRVYLLCLVGAMMNGFAQEGVDRQLADEVLYNISNSAIKALAFSSTEIYATQNFVNLVSDSSVENGVDLAKVLVDPDYYQGAAEASFIKFILLLMHDFRSKGEVVLEDFIIRLREAISTVPRLMAENFGYQYSAKTRVGDEGWIFSDNEDFKFHLLDPTALANYGFFYAVSEYIKRGEVDDLITFEGVSSLSLDVLGKWVAEAFPHKGMHDLFHEALGTISMEDRQSLINFPVKEILGSSHYYKWLGSAVVGAQVIIPEVKVQLLGLDEGQAEKFCDRWFEDGKLLIKMSLWTTGKVLLQFGYKFSSFHGPKRFPVRSRALNFMWPIGFGLLVGEGVDAVHGLVEGYAPVSVNDVCQNSVEFIENETVWAFASMILILYYVYDGGIHFPKYKIE